MMLYVRFYEVLCLPWVCLDSVSKNGWAPIIGEGSAAPAAPAAVTRHGLRVIVWSCDRVIELNGFGLRLHDALLR